MSEQKKVAVTLIRGFAGKQKVFKMCAFGLGLKKRGQTVYVVQTPENLGMIQKIRHMLRVEEL